MKKTTKDEALREFVICVDRIVKKWVPNTVPGEENYRLMIKYQALKEALIHDLFPSIEPKRKKWRQMDLEEAIKNEKDGMSQFPREESKDKEG